MRKFEDTFLAVAPWLIGVATIMLVIVIFQLGKTNERVAQTAAYTRVTNCIVAKGATSQDTTQDEIERCYVQVEKNSGVHLERFDEQTHNEN